MRPKLLASSLLCVSCEQILRPSLGIACAVLWRLSPLNEAVQVKQVARDLSQDFALKPTQAAARAEMERGEVPAAARQVSADVPLCSDAAGFGSMTTIALYS